MTLVLLYAPFQKPLTKTLVFANVSTHQLALAILFWIPTPVLVPLELHHVQEWPTTVLPKFSINLLDQPLSLPVSHSLKLVVAGSNQTVIHSRLLSGDLELALLNANAVTWLNIVSNTLPILTQVQLLFILYCAEPADSDTSLFLKNTDVTLTNFTDSHSGLDNQSPSVVVLSTDIWFGAETLSVQMFQDSFWHRNQSTGSLTLAVSLLLLDGLLLSTLTSEQVFTPSPLVFVQPLLPLIQFFSWLLAVA